MALLKRDSNANKILHQINFIAAFVALAVVNGAITQRTFPLGNLYYAILIIALLLTFFQATIKRLSASMSFIYVCCMLSILLNDIPAAYQPWLRFALFVIVTVIASPFIQSAFYDKFRINLFKYIHNLLILIIVFSIPAIVLNERSPSGMFTGFTNHSMLLAPISAVSLITLIYYLYLNKFNRILILILIAFSFVALLLAASRISLAGFVLAMVFFFYRKNRHDMREFAKTGISILAIFILTYPLWNGYMEGIEKKNEAAINAETGKANLASSREIMWAQRIKEFKSSPFVGIGFCYAPYAIGTDELSGKVQYVETDTGNIEPGSSWLGVLSMTGLLGFLGIISIWISSFRMCFQMEKKDNLYAIYLSSMMVFWCVHMIAEGEIFSAGGFLCFMVWLGVGTVQAAYNVLYNR